MARSSLFSRLLRGRCNRWEQSLVGGLAGMGCGLLLGGFSIWSSPIPPGSDALTVWETALVAAGMGAVFGGIVGGIAHVDPGEGHTWEPFPEPDEDRVKDWIVAFVWPREHASPESLRMLGQELEDWQAKNPFVTRIMGLERLHSGRYPIPDGPTPYVDDPEGGELMPCPCPTPDGIGLELRKLSIVEPWVHCPALVWATEELESNTAIASLRRSISPDLVSEIGYSFS